MCWPGKEWKVGGKLLGIGRTVVCLPGKGRTVVFAWKSKDSMYYLEKEGPL